MHPEYGNIWRAPVRVRCSAQLAHGSTGQHTSEWTCGKTLKNICNIELKYQMLSLSQSSIKYIIQYNN